MVYSWLTTVLNVLLDRGYNQREEVNSGRSLRDSDMRESPFVFSLYIGDEEKGT